MTIGPNIQAKRGTHWAQVAIIAISAIAAVGCTDSKSCSVQNQADGTVLLACEDGTSAVLNDGRSCSVEDTDGGVAIVRCDDGSFADIMDGSGCTVVRDAIQNTTVVQCPNGSRAEIPDGQTGPAGGPCTATALDAGYQVQCPDGTQFDIVNGTSCSVQSVPDAGTTRLACDDGTVAEVKDGTRCSITDNHDGTSTLRCNDGTVVRFASQVCTPLTRRCSIDDLQICNLNGTAFETEKTCASNTCLHGGYCETEGALRLADELAPGFGRLELFHNGMWGTVCADGFDAPEATVACKQMGYARGTVVGRTQGSGNIWLDELACAGFESRLVDCPANALGDHDCDHLQDVMVMCAL